MQQNDEVTATLSRARSELMRHTLFSMNIKTNVLVVAGNEYHIIDSDFRNWLSRDKIKLASIGGKVFGREILLINPYTGTLRTVLRNYLYSLQQKLSISQVKNENDISHLLKDISVYVSQLLNPNAGAVQQIIDSYKQNPGQGLISNHDFAPFIDIEVFLGAKVGVCRHYAVLCCLVAAYLMSKNILPVGQIILERTNLVNSAHSCMHYLTDNKHWIIDPTKCLNRATANNSVILIDDNKHDRPLTPTQPLTPENASPASQSCEQIDISAIAVEKIVRIDLIPYHKLGR